MSTLDDWTAAVAAELGLPASPDVLLVLDLARDVAHSVERPAAPLTAWLAGMAVAGGADPADVAARIRALAASWSQEPT
jgi:hypothetical protein